ncbi:hypothetical protein BC943DRAFT_334035 [Umbelopsis sp. AD052]|nr:hypothetical protein BC943DRAFT_334035 [Umbelopsis sp. AD052]
MLSDLISAHGTTSSSLHSEILESIKLQLQNVLQSKDAQKLVEHIVIIANHVYNTIQTSRQRPSPLDTTQFTNQDTDEAMLIVQRIVEDLQSMRTNADDNLWEQIDSSIVVVEHLIDTILCDSQLPHYNDACGPRSTGLLPPYYNNESIKTKDTDDSKRTYELDDLISAFDRITTSVPRLQDQCFELSEQQRNQMDVATMQATVDRLARGRLDNQRANTPKHRTKPTNAGGLTSEKLVDSQVK